jgi:hypothetical protein
VIFDLKVSTAIEWGWSGGALRWADFRGDSRRYEELVEQCLSDYDLNGWHAKDLYSD